MKPFFVTATGTDIGKTYISAGIIRAARQAGQKVLALKPLLSGYDPAHAAESDSGQLLAAMGQPVNEQNIAAITPWRFAAPLAPDMAAAREGRHVGLKPLIAFCRTAAEAAPDLFLVEGVGGVMVPVEHVYTVRDWIAALEYPAILVGGTYLGTISHILTAAASMQAQNISIAAIILNESPQAPVPAAETAAALAKILPGVAIHAISRNEPESGFKRLAWALSQYQQT